MDLVLTILRCPDHAAPETRTFSPGEFMIGRRDQPGHFVLADPTTQISRDHCKLHCVRNVWYVTDVSKNGTFVNGEKLGASPSQLGDGDRLTIGAYEIEVKLRDAAWPSGAPGGDPFSPPAAPAPAQPAWPAGGFGQTSLQGDKQSLEKPSYGQSSFDPSPFAPSSFDKGNFDKPPSGGPVFDQAAFGQPFASFAAPVAAPRDFAPAPDHRHAAATPAAKDEWWKTYVGGPTAPSDAPPSFAPAPSAPVQDQANVAPAVSGSLADFYEGLGMAPDPSADPAQTLRRAGAILRACFGGLRELIAIGEREKQEFGLDRRFARPDDPFAAHMAQDAALLLLLRDPAAHRLVGQAVGELKIHEIATLQGFHEAVKLLVKRLDPAQFQAAAQGGLRGAIGGNRAFDDYAAEYRRLATELEENFERALGAAFRTAYDHIQADLAANDDGVE